MKDKIKKLKDLRIAYECAINYDYVPDKEEASELVTYMLPKFLNTNIEEVERILEAYSGNSVGNITNLIIDTIDEITPD